MDAEAKTIVTELIKLLRCENAEGIQELMLMCQNMTNSEAIGNGIVVKLEKLSDDKVIQDIQRNMGLWLPAIVFYGGESYQMLSQLVWPNAKVPEGRFSNNYALKDNQTI